MSKWLGSTGLFAENGILVSIHIFSSSLAGNGYFI